MPEEEAISDPFLIQLLEGYNLTEVAEIEKYMTEWDAATYSSVAQSILDHVARKDIDPLKYLRKAHNFNKKEQSEFQKLDIVEIVQQYIVKVMNI
jgi:hypothetical protein